MKQSAYLRLANFSKNLRMSMSSIIRLILVSKWMNILQPFPRKKSGTCIIIGNGPSFNQTIEEHFQLLKDSETLCVNGFVFSSSFEKIQPNYYVLNAPVYFFKDEFLSDYYIQLKTGLFEAIRTKTTWDMYLMLPYLAKKSDLVNQMLRDNPHLKPLYGNSTPVEGFYWLKSFCFKRGLGMPRPHNVLIPSIMNLIVLGYSEIRIIGADHSWLSEISVNDENVALINQKHFYDENESKPKAMQDYFVRNRRLHEILHKFQLTFQGYWDIKEFCEKEGIQIYNSSEKSFIDAFERKKLNEQ